MKTRPRILGFSWPYAISLTCSIGEQSFDPKPSAKTLLLEGSDALLRQEVSGSSGQVERFLGTF